MTNLLAVALGGAVGSVLRYLIAIYLRGTFPWATLVANLAGSAILGFLAASTLFVSDSRTPIRLMLMVGFCGGFTTFSTFSFQTLNYLQTGHVLEAAVNVLLNLIGCLFFTFLGFSIGRSIMPAI